MVRTKVLKHLPGARKGKRGTNGNVRRGVTASEAMEKGGCVWVIEREEVRGDILSNTFSPRGSEVPLESQRE